MGESIPVDFRFEGAGDGRPWIGLIPDTVTGTDEATNDDADVNYEYLPEGTREGMVEVGAAAPGSYRLRLVSADAENGTVVAETPVLTIAKWPAADATAPEPGPTLTLAGGDDEIDVGEAVAVSYAYTARYPQAWIALIPASVTTADGSENDSADVAYEWAPQKAGTVSLATEGVPPGEYRVRLFPCDAAFCDAVAEAGPVTVE